MSKKFVIDWCENKTTSTGKKMMRANLKDDTGALFEDVTVWESYPNFTRLMPGQFVEGDIVEKQSGQYLNKTLYPVMNTISSPQGSQTRTAGIKQAMADKTASISKFQDNKELSIKVASTFSMATNVVITMIKDQPIMDTGAIRSMIEDWRKWFWEKWDKGETDYPPFP
jgi:DNA polymerase III alpha subunit